MNRQVSRRDMPAALCGLAVLIAGLSIGHGAWADDQAKNGPPAMGFDAQILANSRQMIDEGRQTFRYDTFGDEAYWGDTLQLHRAIEGAALGGVGVGVSPSTALAVGLKVDQDALPPSLIAALKTGKVNLDNPATTVALLKLNAVVGVTGFFNDQGTLRSMGI